MKNALNILRSEHQSLAAVLHGLVTLARDAQNPAVRPDFAVFRAMLRYIDSFPERLHHPKEDEFLFRPVIARAAEAHALIDQLRTEHQQGAKLIRTLEQALRDLEAHWPDDAARFAALVEAYSRFHWDHMRVEEDVLMPLAERVLLEEDWCAMEEALAGNEDPIADLREKDFADLFTRIVNIAPAPIGLGERWGSHA